jgi:O-antigen chain-terminating methyltransferase
MFPWRTRRKDQGAIAELGHSVATLKEEVTSLKADLSRASENALLSAAENTERRIAEAQQAIIDFVVTRTDEVYRDLLDKTSGQIDLNESSLRTHLTQSLAEFRRALVAVQHVVNAASPQGTSQTSSAQREGTIDDALYSMLEDRFRGNPADIKARQLSYIPLVESTVSADHPLLDIGCGRGEWLSALQEHGLAAMGVEPNVAFVEECRAEGLPVEKGFVPEYLSGLRDNSLGAVTMFQVAEHLPLQTLLSVFRETQRVLRPSGVIIVEFPNIRTLMVGATTFWIDPTHNRPLHPQLAEFLLEMSGFTIMPAIHSHPVLDIPELDDLSPQTRDFIHRLGEIVGGTGDVAVVATA